MERVSCPFQYMVRSRNKEPLATFLHIGMLLLSG